MPKFYRVYRYTVFLLERFKYLLLALLTFLASTGVLYACHPDQARAETRRNLA